MLKEPEQITYSDRIQPFVGSRVDLLQSWIPRDAKTILDLGCAFGYISTRLATSERRVYGIDVNYRYIAEAHSSYRNAVFLVGAAEAIPFADGLFETVSAFGTVGLSRGVTGDLGDAGRLVIILTMFLGRLGPMTVGLALTARAKGGLYEYPQERVRVG